MVSPAKDENIYPEALQISPRSKTPTHTFENLQSRSQKQLLTESNDITTHAKRSGTTTRRKHMNEFKNPCIEAGWEISLVIFITFMVMVCFFTYFHYRMQVLSQNIAYLEKDASTNFQWKDNELQAFIDKRVDRRLLKKTSASKCNRNQ